MPEPDLPSISAALVSPHSFGSPATTSQQSDGLTVPEPGIELDEGGVEIAARALHDHDIAEQYVDMSYRHCAEHYRASASRAITAYVRHLASQGEDA